MDCDVAGETTRLGGNRESLRQVQLVACEGVSEVTSILTAGAWPIGVDSAPCAVERLAWLGQKEASVLLSYDWEAEQRQPFRLAPDEASPGEKRSVAAEPAGLAQFADRFTHKLSLV